MGTPFASGTNLGTFEVTDDSTVGGTALGATSTSTPTPNSGFAPAPSFEAPTESTLGTWSTLSSKEATVPALTDAPSATDSEAATDSEVPEAPESTFGAPEDSSTLGPTGNAKVMF